MRYVVITFKESMFSLEWNQASSSFLWKASVMTFFQVSNRVYL